MKELTKGNRYFTIAEARIAPKICATKTTPARNQVRQPMSIRPRVTAGLKRPPLMRKKIQALTARLNPNASEMYNS